MATYYAHIEICFRAEDDLKADQYAQWMVNRIKRGFVLPIIEVTDADVFCVERLGA